MLQGGSGGTGALISRTLARGFKIRKAGGKIEGSGFWRCDLRM